MFKPIRSVVETIVKLAPFRNATCLLRSCVWYFSSRLNHYLISYFSFEISGEYRVLEDSDVSFVLFFALDNCKNEFKVSLQSIYYLAYVTEGYLVTLSLRFCSRNSPLRLPVI